MDYQLLIVWEKAIPYIETIIDKIEEDFQIVLIKKFEWSVYNKLKYHDRLYMNDKMSKHSYKVGKGGSTKFIAMVVEDDKPIYGLRHNISNKIPYVNLNITDLKDMLRSLVQGNFVHSSDNSDEFRYQSLLLFGADVVLSIINGENHYKADIYNSSFTEHIIVNNLELTHENFNKVSFILGSKIIYNEENEIILLAKNKKIFYFFFDVRTTEKKIRLFIDKDFCNLRVLSSQQAEVDPLFINQIYRMGENEEIRNSYVTFLLLNLFLNGSFDNLKLLTNQMIIYGPINIMIDDFIRYESYRLKILVGFFDERNFKFLVPYNLMLKYPLQIKSNIILFKSPLDNFKLLLLSTYSLFFRIIRKTFKILSKEN